MKMDDVKKTVKPDFNRLIQISSDVELMKKRISEKETEFIEGLIDELDYIRVEYAEHLPIPMLEVTHSWYCAAIPYLAELSETGIEIKKGEYRSRERNSSEGWNEKDVEYLKDKGFSEDEINDIYGFGMCVYPPRGRTVSTREFLTEYSNYKEFLVRRGCDKILDDLGPSLVKRITEIYEGNLKRPVREVVRE